MKSFVHKFALFCDKYIHTHCRTTHDLLLISKIEVICYCLSENISKFFFFTGIKYYRKLTQFGVKEITKKSSNASEKGEK